MEYKIREKLFGTNKASASGTSLTLNNTVKYPINKLTIDGVCEQETTSGYNLVTLTQKRCPVNLKVGDTITARNDTDTQYTVNLYKEASDTTRDDYWTLNAKTTRVITIGNDAKAIGWSANITNGVAWIVKGTYTTETMPPYEPYTGGQPSPNPDYPQNISVLTGDIKLTSCGKNLFDINSLNFENVWIRPTGEKVAANNNGFLSYVEIIPNVEYILSLNRIVSSIGICEYDKNKNFIQRIVVSNSSSKTIITSTTTKYIGVFINIDGTNLVTKDIIDECEPQLEKSNQATTYEPYQGSSLNITIPSNEFVGKLDDTYKDTLNIVYKDDGHYHLILNKMIGKVVLDGSENWQLSSYTNDIIYSVYATISNYSYGLLISDLFSYQNNVNATTTTEYVATGGDSIRIGVLKSRLNASTIDDFKSWLSTHNTEVCYPLKTPYEVDLGIVDTLLSYDKITNIFSDSDLYPVINVKYYNESLDISNYEFSIKEV